MRALDSVRLQYKITHVVNGGRARDIKYSALLFARKKSLSEHLYPIARLRHFTLRHYDRDHADTMYTERSHSCIVYGTTTASYIPGPKRDPSAGILRIYSHDTFNHNWKTHLLDIL
jgi:hypothetical protein